MAMYGMEEANHLKKGGKVAKFANGGAVGTKKDSINKPYDTKEWNDQGKKTAHPESKVRTLVNDSSNKQPFLEPKAHSIATHKNGGKASAPKGLMIAIKVGKKSGKNF